MAAKKQESNNKSKKRKQNPDAKTNTYSSFSKRPKPVSSKPENKQEKKPFKPFKKQNLGKLKSQSGEEKNTPLSKRERRLHAKVISFLVFFLLFLLYSFSVIMYSCFLRTECFCLFV